MNDLLLLGHLGLGDHLVCNAIVRHLAKSNNLTILVKPHNQASVDFMFRDLVNVETFTVADDTEARSAENEAKAQGYPVFGLGIFGIPPFSSETWDRDFYRQAGIPFQDCWTGFKVADQPSRELSYPKGDYVFIHENVATGCVMNRKRLPKKLKVVAADPKKTNNIFDWWGVIKNAKEIHVMESCFAILVDHTPSLKAQRIVVHDYMRKSVAPIYTNTFERIK
ncbi:MAG: hypothetical protein O2960_24815 [Verrucomicrobia bacterium]|nr:hypothetical protein [Verrucomicrobiota bacterium]